MYKNQEPNVHITDNVSNYETFEFSLLIMHVHCGYSLHTNNCIVTRMLTITKFCFPFSFGLKMRKSIQHPLISVYCVDTLYWTFNPWYETVWNWLIKSLVRFGTCFSTVKADRVVISLHTSFYKWKMLILWQ